MGSATRFRALATVGLLLAPTAAHAHAASRAPHASGLLLAPVGAQAPAVRLLAPAYAVRSPASGPGVHPRAPASAPADTSDAYIRVNQVGYLPDAWKVAVFCSLGPRAVKDFTVLDDGGRRVLGPARALETGRFGPCAATYRLDFSALRRPGRYTVRAGGVTSPVVRIGADVYAGAIDTLLSFMRVQRSGFNPFFRDSVHVRTDAILVDHVEAGRWIDVAGGWADAADYLQYAMTSADATYLLLMTHRDHPAVSPDLHRADGLPGANGVPDVLDEARHGLEWLVKMYPRDDLLLHQIGDDRDHAFMDLPTTDSADYGWGRRGFRPVYPCTGKPQGLLRYRNHSNGYASTAGKFASALALGAASWRDRDSAFAASLERKARAAYELGRQHPGVCQGTMANSPYFYEEENWTDDMELGAAELYALTREPRYLAEAVDYARMEPVTPWMGQDTARHYEWFPWHNDGHYEIWRLAGSYEQAIMAGFYRRGVEAVVARAQNGFRIGMPFIWCSNDLLVSFATQARLYRLMTGDDSFREYEDAAIDWLFGANPWGTSMVIGYPAGGETPTDPHSIISRQLGWKIMIGGLVDGPVYRSIFGSLKGLQIVNGDEFAPFNTGFIVYHDDFGDYSTNEPIMDGTANLIYLVSTLAPPATPASAAAR